MTELEKYREQIDRIDKQLIDLLAERFNYSVHIGRIKGNRGIPVLQSDRWDKVMSSRKRDAVSSGLSEKFTEKFLQLIHNESIRIQGEVAENRES